MRGLLFIIAVTGFALWWGGHHLYIGMRNRAPVEITCADYLKNRPDAEWLRLTHCDADFDNLAFEQTKGDKLTKVYVPLRPEGTASTDPTKIIVERDDEEMLELATTVRRSAPGEITIKRLVAAVAGPTEGLVEVGLDLSDKRQSELANMNLGLAKDFVIVERGAKPRPLMFALGALVLGLGGLSWLAFSLVRRFRRDRK
jgi:hypothetical protein